MSVSILVATDGSGVAGKAVRYAARLAKDLKASLTVLGVADISFLVAPGMAPGVTAARALMETKDAIKQAISGIVDAAAGDISGSGVKVRQVVRTGRPVEEIVKEARKSKAAIIVLGSHGRSAVKAAVLGSVAYGVIHKNSGAPVLVVRK